MLCVVSQALQDSPIFLLGASEGTLLISEAAAKRPRAISGLVMYGVMAENLRSTFRYIMSGGEFLKYRALDENSDQKITRTEWEKVIKNVDFGQADLNQDGDFTVADIEQATKKYIDAIDQEDYDVLHAWARVGAAVTIPDGWFKDHFSHHDAWHFLKDLDIPVGCFHGESDRMTPIAAVRRLEKKAQNAGLKKMEFNYFKGLDHSLNVGQYFAKGTLPAGHKAIFEFIDRIAPAQE